MPARPRVQGRRRAIDPLVATGRELFYSANGKLMAAVSPSTRGAPSVSGNALR